MAGYARDSRASHYYLPPDDDGLSWTIEEPKRVWRKVTLAIGLLLVGSILLLVGIGYYWDGTPGAHGLAMVIIGALLFLPGFYHTRIAYMAWRGDQQGFSLSSIPDL